MFTHIKQGDLHIVNKLHLARILIVVSIYFKFSKFVLAFNSKAIELKKKGNRKSTFKRLLCFFHSTWHTKRKKPATASRALLSTLAVAMLGSDNSGCPRIARTCWCACFDVLPRAQWCSWSCLARIPLTAMSP